ncbi:hypothetical protein PIB30_024300 [Stylosanthes scabra]|uniref:Uncharacterized protein n=1 Tax=Stylosanthes scabra TaxID=79078 RepID=A0ABU6X9X4_9FABA|nr:hypothetical protein [Stylosanthes scabra]
MWNSDSASLDFREKLLHIASLKGDNGKLPYFESLGFTLSSSITLARYLTSQDLPSLMHKVASIKDLLFSHQADHHLINNIRRMMLHLSIPVDDDLQHTLSFFEKLEAKRGGLSVLLSAKDIAFCHLIESFPRLLSLSLDNHVIPIIDFLHNIGVPRSHIPTIILSFPPILFWTIQLLKARLLTFKQIHVVDKDYIKMLIKYPWVLSTSIQENYEEVHAFFLSEKVRKICIDSAIKGQPYLLGCSTGKLKTMLDQLADLGVKGNKLDRIIARSPQVLLRKPRDFLQIVLFFENMGLDREMIGRILSRCPEIFAASIDKTLQRKIEFLSGVGVSEAYLPSVIRKYPELLVTDTDRTMLHRLRYLMKLGLSEKDVGFMVRTFSPLLGYSIEEVLRPKAEFLVKSMGKPVREVVHYPRYFSYSLEKKIKPRYFVLKGRQVECSLKDMLGKNDEEFAAEFILSDNVL